jgi:hypothetical protein
MRSTVARWFVLPQIVLGVASLFGRSRYWIGIWPETGAAAQVSAFFVSIFAAGIAAWIIAQVEARGLHEQAASAAIRPITIDLTRFIAALVWPLLSYLAVAAVAFAATARGQFPPGIGSYFEYILLGAVVVVFGSAWGWLIGKVLTPVVAAVCAALSWFVVASTLVGSPVSGPPWMYVDLGVLSLRFGVVIAFVLAVCAVPWRAGRQDRFVKRVVIAVVVLLAVAGVHASTAVIGHRAPSAKPLCVNGTIEYCLWPEDAKYVGLVKAVDREVAVLPVRLPLPARIVDYGLSGSSTFVDGIEVIHEGNFSPEFDISEGSRWALARGVALAITQAVFAGCDPAVEDPDNRAEQIFAWLEWRLAGGGIPDYTTNAPPDLQAAWSAGRRAGAESEQAQAAWVSRVIGEKMEHYCHVV